MLINLLKSTFFIPIFGANSRIKLSSLTVPGSEKPIPRISLALIFFSLTTLSIISWIFPMISSTFLKSSTWKLASNFICASRLIKITLTLFNVNSTPKEYLELGKNLTIIGFLPPVDPSTPASSTKPSSISSFIFEITVGILTPISFEIFCLVYSLF